MLLYCTVVYHCTTVLLSTVDEACKRDSVWAGETLAPSESFHKGISLGHNMFVPVGSEMWTTCCGNNRFTWVEDNNNNFEVIDEGE